jgi:hypothetical protein
MKTPILILTALALFGCGSSDFSEVGNFKDKRRNRAYTLNCNACDLSEMEAYADKQMHTAGQLTYIAFYKGNAPDITAANDYFIATELAEAQSPIAVWVRNPRGVLNNIQTSPSLQWD